MTPTPITLTGYLGNNREIRWTKETVRTTVRKVDELPRYEGFDLEELTDEVEVTIPARPYAVLSLPQQQKNGNRWETVWVRLIVWDLYRGTTQMPVLLARKGDKVRVTGHMETVTFIGGDGNERTMTQLVVSTFSILESKFNRDQGYTPKRPSPPVIALATRKSG